VGLHKKCHSCEPATSHHPSTFTYVSCKLCLCVCIDKKWAHILCKYLVICNANYQIKFNSVLTPYSLLSYLVVMQHCHCILHACNTFNNCLICHSNQYSSPLFIHKLFAWCLTSLYSTAKETLLLNYSSNGVTIKLLHIHDGYFLCELYFFFNLISTWHFPTESTELLILYIILYISLQWPQIFVLSA
jgi:hypothetical protein